MDASFKSRIATLSPAQLQLLALDLRARLDRVQAERREPIAVVGLGCRFPGADGPDELWRVLSQGEDVIRDVPTDRWNAEHYFDPDPDARGRMATRWGGFLDRIDTFDAEFFGIAPREARGLDPQHRLLLEVTWEALENAGISADAIRGSATGVFVGICGSDYFQLCVGRGYDSIDTYLASGASASVASGRLAYVLGLEGPTYSIDTACSSSLMAVHTAVRSLRTGECRTAIAAGVNALIWPGGTIALSRGRMMASDGRCKTFDARGDGFVRGEGCGVVVLKRLSDAITDGDPVLALIRGTAANQDGRSNGLTAPNGRAQAAVIRDALADAGVEPAAISYVEAHGTGTSLGDPIEVHALGVALSPGRPANDPLMAASIKTNMGHLEAAAGIAGLIKTVLMVQKRQIPPNLHFREPNPLIDWANVPVTVPTGLVPWEPRVGRRVAGVSSFGLSGSNAHVIVEEAPVLAPITDGAHTRELHVLPLSARSEPALRELAARYERAFDADPSLSLADVSLTAGIGRVHFDERAAIVARTIDEARVQLRDLAEDRPDGTASRGTVVPAGAPGIAFLYTGEGTQYVGMGARLLNTEPVFRAALERCAAILDPLLSGNSLLRLMHASDVEDRHRAQFTPPMVLALQFALTELWRSWGIVPSAVMGHSLGEFAAACSAGVFAIEDALPLVVERARLMRSAPGEGLMLSVAASGDDLAEHLRAFPSLSIAALNGPSSTVLSGPRADVEAVATAVARQGIEVRRLDTSHASHSILMEPVLDDFERAVSRAPRSVAQRVLISGLTGGIADEAVTTTAYWRTHLRQPVRFADSMAQLVAMGARLFVEIGPHPSLIAMARRYTNVDGVQWLASMRRDRDDAEQIAETLAALYVNGAPVDWKGVMAGRGARKVTLPTYPFERESFWIETTDAAAPASAPERAADKPAKPSDDWLYEARWERSPAEPSAAVLAGSRWVLVGGESSLRFEISKLLTRGAAAVHVVALPTAQDSAFEQYLADAVAATAHDGVADHVLYLEGASDAPSHDGVDAGIERTCRGALALSRTMVAMDWTARLWFVTEGGTPATRVTSVASGALGGFARVVAAEHPGMWGGHVDVDRSPSDLRARLVVDEIVGQRREPSVAFVGGRRFVARLARTTRASVAPASRANLRADATYIITGALGGIGMRLAAWLVDAGARHLALVARRAPSDAEARVLDALRARGVVVRLVHADVAIEAHLIAGLNDVRQHMPPIAGVFHTAGVSDEAVIERLEWARFAKVLAPKVGGAWHLHEHTRGDALDHFVLFSSAAALLGAAGVANYAAANAALDALAHLRRADGLPALSVNWAAWAGLGMAAAVEAAGNARWARSGLATIASDDALAVLGELMASDAPAQTAVLPIEWSVFRSTTSGASPLFSHFPAAAPTEITAGDDATPQPDAPRTIDRAALASLGEQEVYNAIAEFLRGRVARELGVREERIASTRPLNALGLDSLMAVQLRNRVQEALQVSVPISRFIDGATLDQLTGDVVERVQRAKPVSVEPSSEPVAAPIVDVNTLSDDDVERMLREMLEGGTTLT